MAESITDVTTTEVATRGQTTNWAGNITFAGTVHYPQSMAEVQSLVAGAGSVHALGTGHSFTEVADTDGLLINLSAMPHQCHVETDGSGQVGATVSAGMTFAEVAPQLEAAGYALHNMGSLPHISVAGACSTGTHGSGDRAPCMAAAVRAVQMVTASCDVLTLDRSDPDFAGLLPGLGVHGIITSLTFDVEPSYAVAQTVWEGIKTATGLEHFDAIMGSAYNVSVFTTLNSASFGDAWVKRRMDESDPDLRRFGGAPAVGPRRPVPGQVGKGCTVQGGIPGRWFERLPHFTPDVPPSSSGAELQSEYYVTRADGPAALRALWQVGSAVRGAMQICELRTVAADGLWLSPAGETGMLGIHFTWGPDERAAHEACREVEQALEPFAPVPHWGKVSTLPADVVSMRYPRMDDARTLARRLDPDNVFGNAFTDRYLRSGT